MKKIFLLLSVPLFMIACNNKDNTPPKEILGDWKMEYYIHNGEKNNLENDYVVVFTGNWYVKQIPYFQERGVPFSLNGNILEWEAKGDNETVKFKYKYSLKGDTLVLENLIENSFLVQGTSYYSKK